MEKIIEALKKSLKLYWICALLEISDNVEQMHSQH